MPRDAVSRTANVERTGRHKWVNVLPLVLLFDDNKIKMTRKPGKKQKENPVGYTGKGER